MKVKTLACLCALAAAPAFGDTAAVTSENTFGVLKVTCNTAKAIIATPWVSCENINDAVKVTNLVMTANLSENDAIIVYVNEAFKGWKLASGAWSPLNVSSAETYGIAVGSGDSTSEAIARGKAFWFIKNGFTSGTYDLYLYGQDKVVTTTDNATVVANAYNLLANPKVAELDLATSSLWTGMTINANDRIVVPNGANAPTEYSYVNGAWGHLVENGRVAVWTAGGTIPAGRGFWYISKGGSGTITW